MHFSVVKDIFQIKDLHSKHVKLIPPLLLLLLLLIDVQLQVVEGSGRGYGSFGFGWSLFDTLRFALCLYGCMGE